MTPNPPPKYSTEKLAELNKQPATNQPQPESPRLSPEEMGQLIKDIKALLIIMPDEEKRVCFAPDIAGEFVKQTFQIIQYAKELARRARVGQYAHDSILINLAIHLKQLL